jgi:hypothetical protein
MKFLFWFAVLLLLNILIPAVFPEVFWWYIAITGGWMGYFSALKNWQAGLVGFAAVFILWVGYASFLDAEGGHRLSSRLVDLFGILTANSDAGLFFLVGCVGGSVSGLSALSGSLIKTAFDR